MRKSERSAREQRKKDNFVSKTGASVPVGLASVGNARIVRQQQHTIALLGRSLDDHNMR
jgi:hypothetical protein